MSPSEEYRKAPDGSSQVEFGRTIDECRCARGRLVTSQAGQRPDSAPPFLGYVLVRVAHLLSQKMDRQLADLELSANGYGVLFQLQSDPGVSSAELARRVILTPQSVGPLLARMARDGLVDREQAGGPGTAIITRITTEGRRRLAAATALVHALDGELAGLLDPAARDALDQQLWDMLRSLATSGTPHACDLQR